MITQLSKGKRFFAPTLTAILALAMAFTFNGCASSVGAPIGTVYQIGGPVKDVEILGLVYVKCNEGEPVYQALMRAAEKKGGNGIANVVIDVESISTWFFWITSQRNTKYASALAIKYTNVNIVSDASSKDGKVGIPSEQTSPWSSNEHKK
jgi:hypothetical protein